MNGSNWWIMLHIPEAELHAYLDQALSRLRCVEIESHLAECTPCRAARDEIAALRDRTTAMLARLAPRGTVPPPIIEIRRRAAVRLFKRERIRQRVAWAASILLALGIGWAGASYLAPHSPGTVARGPSTPAVTHSIGNDTVAHSLPTEAVATTGPQPTTPEPPAVERRAESDLMAGHRPVHQGRPRSEGAEPAALAASGRETDGEPDAGTSRNSERPADRSTAAGRTEGVTVADAPAPGTDTTRKPSMITSQQLKSGEVVRAAQGPVSDIATLLTSRPTDTAGSGDAAPARAGSPAGNFSFRQADRVFNSVGGNLPSDSLRAMMRRLNLMSRVR